jgi:hypothetical protein
MHATEDFYFLLLPIARRHGAELAAPGLTR